jgi:hypothetical protein
VETSDGGRKESGPDVKELLAELEVPFSSDHRSKMVTVQVMKTSNSSTPLRARNFALSMFARFPALTKGDIPGFADRPDASEKLPWGVGVSALAFSPPSAMSKERFAF